MTFNKSDIDKHTDQIIQDGTWDDNSLPIRSSYRS